MARIHLSDEACDRLVASRDPIDARRLYDEAVSDRSRRLYDELLTELAGAPSSRNPAARWAGQSRRFGSRRRRVAAASVLAAVVAGMLAIFGSLPVGGNHNGPLDVQAASAAVVLDQAAQAAMRSTSVVPGQGQYGFVRVETGSVVGTASGTAPGPTPPTWNAWMRMSAVRSDWYNASGSGRERIVRSSIGFLTPRDRAIAQAHGMTLGLAAATFPRVLDGAFSPRTLQTAGFLPYWQMARLPTQPAALRRALERLLLASDRGQGHGLLKREIRTDPAGMFGPISQFLFLPTSPQLRAALFRVLAELPGVQLLGHQRDRLGRSGIAVAVTQGGPDRVREELLFDPATSDLLQTKTIELGTSTPAAVGGARRPTFPAGTVVQYTDFISRGVVNSIMQLPGGGRLPLRPAGGSR